MKTKLILLVLTAFLTFITKAQDCESYYPFQEGASYEMSGYNKKGKLNTVSKYHIKELSSTGSGNVATIDSKLFDEKGKLIMDSEFEAICNDGVVSIDFESLVSPQLLENYKDMDIDMKGTNLEIPANLSTGMQLPDANVDLAVNISGIKMKINISITDRTVDKQETISTSAGTFDCFIISYKTSTKMGANIFTTNKQWISKNVGVVKDEYYNKSGKLMGYSELTAFSK